VKYELWVYEAVNRLMRRAPHLAPHLTDLFEGEIDNPDDLRDVMRKCGEAGIQNEVQALLRYVEQRSERQQWPN
jgi:hypothetical protein